MALRADVERTSQALAESLFETFKRVGLTVAFSLRHDFPDAWRMLVTSPAGTVVTLSLAERHLPAAIADWLGARALSTAKVVVAPGGAPVNVKLVTQPSGTPLQTLPQIVAWVSAGARPNPLPDALAFAAGADGLYAAPVSGTATLQGLRATAAIGLRLDQAGDLAPAAATGLTLDESKLRDVVLSVTFTIAS